MLTLTRLENELGRLSAEGQYRELDTPAGINLCSNDYLGLSADSRVREALLAEITEDKGRVGSTGSRLLSGNSAAWEQIESEFAQFVGAQSALFFSSGYAANLGLLTSVLRPDDIVFSDASNHASLIDGIRLSRARKVIFPHLDMNFLERELERRRPFARELFIVVESVFSMEGDRAPLTDLFALAERHGASVIVDEAHATGVLGPRGRGLASEAGRHPSLLATIHTCGKALAAAGAFVACSETLKRYLVNRARTFIFSTALPPYFAGQLRAALRIAHDADAERRRLESLSDFLRGRLQCAGFDPGRSSSQIVPIVAGSNEEALRIDRDLRGAGFVAKAIRPPTVPAGTARLRISLNVTLSDVVLQRFVDCLASVHEPMATAR